MGVPTLVPQVLVTGTAPADLLPAPALGFVGCAGRGEAMRNLDKLEPRTLEGQTAQRGGCSTAWHTGTSVRCSMSGSATLCSLTLPFFDVGPTTIPETPEAKLPPPSSPVRSNKPGQLKARERIRVELAVLFGAVVGGGFRRLGPLSRPCRET